MCSSKLLDNNTLSGKTVLITGCNRGIGESMMNLFAEHGASIIACCRKSSSEFEQKIQVVAEKNNVSITPLYFDLTNEDEIKKAINSLLSNKIKIDVLINNAGVAYGSLLQMTSMKTLKEVFEINFFSQVLITQYIAKLMTKQKGGSIINMASVAGIDSFAGYTAYGCSKAAIIYFTKTIAKELAPFNIRVNAIAPGLTDTQMAVMMEDKAKTDMITKSAFNRLGKPEEIAQLALFLASDQSSFITGQVIRIDGGM